MKTETGRKGVNLIHLIQQWPRLLTMDHDDGPSNCIK
jgi:hypothetical protein